MIVSEETAAPIIERLLLALVDDKRKVVLEANCLPGRVNWSFRVDINDTGKVIGTQGTHLRAIQLVLDLIGKSAGEEWCGVSLDPFGVDRGVKIHAETPARHSTAEDLQLLKDLFAAMGIRVTVNVLGSVADSFTFEVRGERVQDHAALLDNHEAIYKRNQPSREPLNVLGAVGTLYRSIGRRQGVRYRIAVPIA